MKKFFALLVALTFIGGPASAQGTLGLYTRNNVVLAVDSATPAAVDTLLTFQKQVGNHGRTTLTGAQTNYVITTGKTLRIQSINYTYTQSGATAARVRVFLRINTAGTCVAASSLLIPVELGPPAFGTAAANTGTDTVSMPIPEGYEIKGDGTLSICFSAIASSAAGTLTVSMVGWEY
jgi:hypothetical protein